MSHDIDTDWVTGNKAWEGSLPSRAIDQERTLRLRLAILDDDIDVYLATLGAILRDESGANRLSAIVATINTLVADMQDLTVGLVGEDITRDTLKAALLESLRDGA
jgi:hypothetical protein